MRIHTPRTAASVCALVALALTTGTPPSAAPGTQDGTSTYEGVFHGRGTLTVRGGGTLILTGDSDFTPPRSRQRQIVRTSGGNHPHTTVTSPDPPAITAERGATLQYGTGPGTRAGTATGPGAGDTRATHGAAGRFGWWPYVLALGLLGALVFPATARTRGKGQRGGGRHAARE
ncbi:hypothetical protein J2Z21_000962 [Streptomyces griseochromogenes]|uniref:Uncharacterized protein n=1 Tax=Streptomyces griseochromogenes TaxID=68214 RepID=A0A1B1AUQ7_9ACTN|nr:hypothetical protein AVL59_12305 [Streptomyces griseochromogenes]MBP2048038.1 hypothetical protein [Streptomyces griseochromogenes]